MADTKGSALSTFTPVLTDRLLGIDDPSGTPVSGSVTGTALLALMKTSMDTYYYGKANVAYTTSDFSKTSDTTLAAVTGLTHTLEASGVYRFSACLYLSCNASGGAKVAVSGTCTATTIYALLCLQQTTAIKSKLVSTLDNTIAEAAADICAFVNGTITVAKAGTLLLQFAQNASYATASKVLKGSWFEVDKMN